MIDKLQGEHVINVILYGIKLCHAAETYARGVTVEVDYARLNILVPHRVEHGGISRLRRYVLCRHGLISRLRHLVGRIAAVFLHEVHVFVVEIFASHAHHVVTAHILYCLLTCKILRP